MFFFLIRHDIVKEILHFKVYGVTKPKRFLEEGA